MSPPLLPALADLPAPDRPFWLRAHSIVSTTPANDTTDVAVGASITVKIDDSIVSVKVEGAIEVRLQLHAPRARIGPTLYSDLACRRPVAAHYAEFI